MTSHESQSIQPALDPPHGIVTPPGAAKSVSMLGARIDFLAAAAETGGAWSCLTYATPPHYPGPPLHWHERTVEGFYVLEGTLGFALGDREMQAEPGTWVLVPPRVPHRYFNSSDTPAKYLLILSPPGFERYFEDQHAYIQREKTWPPKTPEDLEALLRKYDYHLA